MTSRFTSLATTLNAPTTVPVRPRPINVPDTHALPAREPIPLPSRLLDSHAVTVELPAPSRSPRTITPQKNDGVPAEMPESALIAATALSEVATDAAAGPAESIVAAFTLSPAQLQRERDILGERIQRGLREDGTQIAALAAFLPAPRRDLRGEVTVLDTGGTNMRAGVVSIDSSASKVLRRVQSPLPRAWREASAHVSASEFFGDQAARVVDANPSSRQPVGYCFSFPIESLRNHDAVLVRWTKGVVVRDVEHTRVGSGLRAAMPQSLRPNTVAVLNDAVASLMGGAFVKSDETHPAEGFISLVAGTGHNISGFFVVPKLGRSTRRIAVNLETGNFVPTCLTKYDDSLDARGGCPGAQRFEKATAGRYLPALFNEIMPGAIAADKDSAELSRLVKEEPESTKGQVAKLLLDRAADLLAAALAAVIDQYDTTKPITIIGEGSLIDKAPGFKERMMASLAALLRERGLQQQPTLVHADDANLIGAGCAALMAEHAAANLRKLKTAFRAAALARRAKKAHLVPKVTAEQTSAG